MTLTQNISGYGKGNPLTEFGAGFFAPIENIGLAVTGQEQNPEVIGDFFGGLGYLATTGKTEGITKIGTAIYNNPAYYAGNAASEVATFFAGGAAIKFGVKGIGLGIKAAKGIQFGSKATRVIQPISRFGTRGTTLLSRTSRVVSRVSKPAARAGSEYKPKLVPIGYAGKVAATEGITYGGKAGRLVGSRSGSLIDDIVKQSGKTAGKLPKGATSDVLKTSTKALQKGGTKIAEKGGKAAISGGRAAGLAAAGVGGVVATTAATAIVEGGLSLLVIGAIALFAGDSN